MSLSYNKIEIVNEAYGEPGLLNSPSEFVVGGRFVTCEIDVLNAAVYMETLTSATGEAGQALWDQELWLSPQHRTVSRQGIFGVRFRADPLTPGGTFAIVTVQFIGENEAWPNLNQLIGK